MTQRLSRLGWTKPHFYQKNEVWHYVYGLNHIMHIPTKGMKSSPQLLIKYAIEYGLNLGPQKPREYHG